MVAVMPKPSAVTHLNGLVPEGGVGEIVPVDLISCGVYVYGSHYLARYAALWWRKNMLQGTDEDFLDLAVPLHAANPSWWGRLKGCVNRLGSELMPPACYS